MLPPPWRECHKALLTQGDYHLSHADGKTNVGPTFSKLASEFCCVYFCMSKRKPVWMEPWFSGTLWLSWSAEYCLLSMYKMRPKVSQIQRLKWVHGKCWCLICYSCSYRKSPPLLFPFLNYSEGIFLVFKEYIWFWHYLPQLLCSHLNTSCKSSTNNMEVSVELPLLFPDICLSKLIWLDWEDEETASSLHVMRNCKFFFWIRVLQLFWQHYTHPSVLPSFILPSVTAQMLELNCSVTVRQCVHSAVVFF